MNNKKLAGATIFLTMFCSQASMAESMFPIGGDQAREQGIELPLPYGLSISYTNQQDATSSSNLRFLKVDGDEVPIETIQLGDSSSDTDVVSARFDLWLLPFLNVYGMVGKLEGTAEQIVTIGPQPVEVTQDFEGHVYGAGLTLVYGYERFIASLDLNYSWTNLDVTASEMETWMLSPRVGFRSVVADMPYSIMVGASYVDMRQTMTMEGVRPNGKITTTLLDTDSLKAWNTVVTAQLELDRHWQLVVDAGFNDRETITGSLTYRF